MKRIVKEAENYCGFNTNKVIKRKILCENGRENVRN